MRYVNPKLVVAAQVMTADVIQSITTAQAPVAGMLGPVHDYANFAFHVIWTGTPTGNHTIEGSGDGGNTWTAFTGMSKAAGGAAGSYIFDFTPGTGVDLVRYHYVFTASTGTVNVWFNAKGWA